MLIVDVPVWPQPAFDLFTRNQLAGPLEQETEQIDHLSAEPHPVPSDLQAPSAIIKLEVSERFHPSGPASRLYVCEGVRGKK